MPVSLIQPEVLISRLCVFVHVCLWCLWLFKMREIFWPQKHGGMTGTLEIWLTEQKLISEICTSEHLKVGKSEGGKRSGDDSAVTAQSSKQYAAEGAGIRWQFALFAALNIPAWMISVFHVAEPANWGRNQHRDRIQSGDSCVLVTTIASQKKAESRNLDASPKLPIVFLLILSQS